jgi:hypothetical protein
MDAGQNVFRREGEYWTIAFEGSLCRLRDTKGLRHLAYLLRHPETRVSAVELLDATHEAPGIAAGGDGSRPQPADVQCATAYQSRLVDLQLELERARSADDGGRVWVLEQEIKFLSSRLEGATREQRADLAAERARLAVTKGIKSALEKIRANNPALERHLTATIRRGYFCCYTPDPRSPIRWNT